MNRTVIALFGALTALGFAACGEEEGTQLPSALREVEPDCLECLEALTECTSTSKNEMHFLGCRDLFQACQDKMSLGPEECGRPSNQIACELCQERAATCEGNACKTEFSVCKTFLMSRDQDRCTEDNGPSAGTCDTCVEALASCAFSGDDASVCETTFASCRKANKLDAAECGAPDVEAACAACLDQHPSCVASGTEGCDSGWGACVGALATEGACGDGPGSGGGAGGGSTTGPEPTCAHDACEGGEAMSAGCDDCIAAVCDLDPYCCETAYDETCVSEAQSIATCGCAAPEETCAHDVCEAGDILDPTCSSCVESVCQADGFCCTTSWDDLCVSNAVELCGATCG